MSKKIQVGDIAPEFKADSTDGKLVLSEIVDKSILLYFYPKDMTPGCTMQANDFSKLYAKFKEHNVMIIGVSCDTLSSHDEFCKSSHIPYPLISDTKVEICALYQVLKKRTDKNQSIFMLTKRSTFLIDKNKKIINIWDEISPKDHAVKVLEFIKNMKTT